ncbi:MAG: hypothetical protein IJF38_06320 [Clostridia bacterium]|nr:hypothetical protein [Clostridia bacterium]
MKKIFLLFLLVIIALCLCLTACGGESSWLVGEGAPDGSIKASVGDLYLDETTQQVYKLTPDGWVMLTPADGARGAKCHSGTAVSGEGEAISATVEGAIIGDIYINTDTGYIYECVGVGVWKRTSVLSGDAKRIGSVVSEVVSSGSARELRVTVTYTDGTSEVTSYKTPLGIDKIEYVDDTYRTVGNTEPVRIKVIYENGDAEFIGVTEDMYILDTLHTAPDLNTVGTYRCAVKYGGRATSFRLEVISIHANGIKTLSPEHSHTVMRADASGALVADEIFTSFFATSAAGKVSPLSNEDISLDFSDYKGVGVSFTAYATLKENESVECEFTVLPIREVDEVPYTALSLTPSVTGAVGVSSSLSDIPKELGLYATLSLTLGRYIYTADIPIEASMLRELDGTQYAFSAHPPKPLVLEGGVFGAECDGLILLEVYDGSESTLVGVSLTENCFRLGVANINSLSLTLELKTRYGTRYTLSTDDLSVPDFSASMIYEGSINFNLSGGYPVKIFYDYDADGIMDAGEVTSDTVTIYASDGSNIKSVEFERSYTAVIGDTLDEFLEEELVGKVAKIWHFDYLNLPYSEIAITKDMLDVTDISELVDGRISKSGEYTVYIRLKSDYTLPVTLRVTADSGRDESYTKIYLNESTATAELSPFTVAYLFENGTAILNPYLTPDGLTGGYASYTLEGSTLRIKHLGTTLVYTLGALSDGTSGIPEGYYEAKLYRPEGTPTLYTGSANTASLNRYDAYVYADRYILLVLKEAVATAMGVTDRVLLTAECSSVSALSSLELLHGMTLTFSHTEGAKSFVIE